MTMLLDPSQSIAGDGAQDDAKDFLSVFFPLAHLTKESTAAREIEWHAAGTFGNNALNLSEMEKWIEKRLMALFDKKRGMVLNKLFFPVYTRAFRAARAVPAAKSTDVVNHAEFRLLIAYLCVYALAFDAFLLVDSPDGAAGKACRDQRLSRAEWNEGKHRVINHGFTSLQTDDEEDAATDLFDHIDVDGSGTIQLTEWCNFLRDAEIAARTRMGIFLSMGAGDEYDPLAEKEQLVTEHKIERQIDVTSGGQRLHGRTTKNSPKTRRPCEEIAGEGASDNIKDFLDVFLPLLTTKRTIKTEWEKASTGKEGLTLNMVGEWVNCLLSSSFDKNHATELYNDFFPVYTRAFHASRDVPGTLSPHEVNQAEFGLLIAYLCVDALAMDAFCAVRVGKNRRTLYMAREEWLFANRKSSTHGLIALSNVGTKQEALYDLFSEMDANGRGTVRLTEWCDYLISSELQSDSAIGTFLRTHADKDKTDTYEKTDTVDTTQQTKDQGRRLVDSSNEEEVNIKLQVDPIPMDSNISTEISTRNILLGKKNVHSSLAPSPSSVKGSGWADPCPHLITSTNQDVGPTKSRFLILGYVEEPPIAMSTVRPDLLGMTVRIVCHGLGLTIVTIFTSKAGAGFF